MNLYNAPAWGLPLPPHASLRPPPASGSKAGRKGLSKGRVQLHVQAWQVGRHAQRHLPTLLPQHPAGRQGGQEVTEARSNRQAAACACCTHMHTSAMLLCGQGWELRHQCCHTAPLAIAALLQPPAASSPRAARHCRALPSTHLTDAHDRQRLGLLLHLTNHRCSPPRVFKPAHVINTLPRHLQPRQRQERAAIGAATQGCTSAADDTGGSTASRLQELGAGAAASKATQAAAAAAGRLSHRLRRNPVSRAIWCGVISRNAGRIGARKGPCHFCKPTHLHRSTRLELHGLESRQRSSETTVKSREAAAAARAPGDAGLLTL